MSDIAKLQTARPKGYLGSLSAGIRGGFTTLSLLPPTPLENTLKP